MIQQRLQKAMTDVGFQDIRFEKLKKIVIKGRNIEIKSVDVIEKEGGHARALIGGGFGTISFNKIDDAEDSIKQCIQYSKLISGEKKLAHSPVVKDIVEINAEVDPRSISIDDKKELLLKYGELAIENGVTVVDLEYVEEYSEKYYVNNEGTSILQYHVDATICLRMICKRNDLTQQTRIFFGGDQNYKKLIGREQDVINKAEQTVALLDAEPIKGGQYDVVLHPSVGGLFIHEAFGHLSESDFLLDSEALRKTMELGKVFATEKLSVVDDPSAKGYTGSFIYDDEGVKAKKTYLIRNGKLSGRLHSRMTAGLTDEQPTGHCRAESFEYTPIVRMGNTYIDSGDSNFDDIVESTKEGLLLFGCAGGQTSGDMFTFAVQGGYKIKNGKIGEMVRDIILTGNLFTTLKNIDMIGDKCVMCEGGGCGKQGQTLRAICMGSPYIRIKSMSIGGK